jgi:hypothetical protein
VREEAKQHLSYHVGNVERYTDREGLSESCWQMMRMPRVGAGMMAVRIFTSRMIGGIVATVAFVRVYVRIFPTQMRIRIIHAL